MAQYTQKKLENLNKHYKKIFKASGCRILSDEEVQNISDSMSLLNSNDVKIIEAAKNGNYSDFNSASPLIRNYIGTLAANKFTAETGVTASQLSLSNDQVKKYIQDHVLDAGFRVGLSAMKHTFPDNTNLKMMDEYANEHLLAKTLSAPSTENINSLITVLGENNAHKEVSKALAKQVVLAKTLFLAQLGKYSLTENGETTDYLGSIAETFAHGGRTNFILPHNDINNEVLTAFEGRNIGKTAEIKSRIAATHSATQRKLNLDLSIAKESTEEKPKYSQLSKIFSNQYGMDIAIGGVGTIGPNQKPILSNGSAGHMYIRKQQGTENTCGSLMIGIESAASLKTSHTGHFHTPLAKSSKQSAFLSDKFGPGEKTNGKTVDLSGLDCEQLSATLNEFEKNYVALQASNPEALNKVNEMLSGKRLSEPELVSLMTESLGMQGDFAKKLVSEARKGLDSRVQKEVNSLESQFQSVLGINLSGQVSIDSIKVMQKNSDNKWILSNLFSENDTQEHRFRKFMQSVQNGQQLYLVSNTKTNPTFININNKKLSLGDNAEKLNIAIPKEPNGIQKIINKITRGLLFGSTIKQYEASKQSFEQQQAMNAFIDKHKSVVEQTRANARSQENQSQFREQLAQKIKQDKMVENLSRIKETVVKDERNRQL